MVEQVAKDLRKEFPDMKGFSSSNLNYMLLFAREWADKSIFQQGVGKLAWGHNIALLTKLKSNQERLWYAQFAITGGWSRNV